MGLIVAGVSHHTAPLALRERLVVSPSETDAAALRIRDEAGAREAVLLSTCNRTEVYAVEGDVDAVPAIWSSFSALLGEDASETHRTAIIAAAQMLLGNVAYFSGDYTAAEERYRQGLDLREHGAGEDLRSRS